MLWIFIVFFALLVAFIIVGVLFSWGAALGVLVGFLILVIILHFVLKFVDKVRLNKIRRNYNAEKNESGPESKPPKNFGGRTFERTKSPVAMDTVSEGPRTSELPSDEGDGESIRESRSSDKRDKPTRFNPI